MSVSYDDQMLKIIVVAAVVAFAVGIIVGVNSTSDRTSRVEQVLTAAAPTSSDVPQFDPSDPGRLTNVEKIGSEITVLKLLENRIAERNVEYEALISEINRLRTIEATLAEEIEKEVFLPRRFSGQ